jgi:hypothetical protein
MMLKRESYGGEPRISVSLSGGAGAELIVTVAFATA